MRNKPEMSVTLKFFVMFFIGIFFSCEFVQPSSFQKNAHFYCTSADERFLPVLMRLLASIFKNDDEYLGEIAIFDLGFSPKQRALLNNMQKVKVYELEKAHPDILTHFITSPEGRKVRGWFAWKPVAIKQALDVYPYILYLDAGMEVFKPLGNVFEHIRQQGYFLIDAGPYSIESRITKSVLQKLVSCLKQEEQQLVLLPSTRLISAGIQGLTRALYNDYVFPVYQHASDLSLFADDGSARLGFGAGRHDQIIFSIYAYLNNLKIYSEGWLDLVVNGAKISCHMHWDRKQVNEHTLLIY